jgi:hypothetical protein
MWLSKPTGGTTHAWEGREYHWPEDNPVCEVPRALGEELLRIRGAGYSEVPAPPKPVPAAAKAAPARDGGDGKTPA